MCDSASKHLRRRLVKRPHFSVVSAGRWNRQNEWDLSGLPDLLSLEGGLTLSKTREERGGMVGLKEGKRGGGKGVDINTISKTCWIIY